MITKDSVEAAYCFFHQKWFVFKKSDMDWQKDDIEYAISNYTFSMSPELYDNISDGNPEFLREHTSFAHDLELSVSLLEKMMG